MKFSLRSLLALTGIVAVLCCLFFVMPAPAVVIVIGVSVLSLPVILVAAIVYGRGYVRAFAIGSISWWGCLSFGLMYLPMMVLGGANSDTFESAIEAVVEIKTAFAILLGIMLWAGSLAVIVRWVCLKQIPRQPNQAAVLEAPQTMLIDPHDKAELYAILQGRIGGQPVAQGMDGAFEFQ